MFKYMFPLLLITISIHTMDYDYGNTKIHENKHEETIAAWRCESIGKFTKVTTVIKYLKTGRYTISARTEHGLSLEADNSTVCSLKEAITHFEINQHSNAQPVKDMD